MNVNNPTPAKYGEKLIALIKSGEWWVLCAANDHLVVVREIVRRYYADFDPTVYDCQLAPQLGCAFVTCHKSRMTSTQLAEVIRGGSDLGWDNPEVTSEALESGTDILFLAEVEQGKRIARFVQAWIVAVEAGKN